MTIGFYVFTSGVIINAIFELKMGKKGQKGQKIDFDKFIEGVDSWQVTRFGSISGTGSASHTTPSKNTNEFPPLTRVQKPQTLSTGTDIEQPNSTDDTSSAHKKTTAKGAIR